jgi:hypothetical protein
MPYQAEALARFADGRPRRLSNHERLRAPYGALVRRNLLAHAGAHGEGLYAITESGRAELAASGYEPPACAHRPVELEKALRDTAGQLRLLGYRDWADRIEDDLAVSGEPPRDDLPDITEAKR